MARRGTQDEFDARRNQLSAAQGKQYWRSLEELADTAEFREFVEREFPNHASEWRDDVSRRRFLQLMGASFALAGLTACTRQPAESIVPYVEPAVEIELGKPLYFATAMPFAGGAEGLLVESHEGRPTKIEGHPQHPANLGATSLFAQASILTLYNPDRAKTVTHFGDIQSWGAFLSAMQAEVGEQRTKQGAGLRFLSETVTSPTLANQIKILLAEMPQAKWVQYEPVNDDNARAGAKLAFGSDMNAVYRFDQADVIVALDADFLACGAGSVRYARDFAMRRKLLNGDRTMNRLYVIESAVTNTGASADHRLPLKPSEIESFARSLAAALGVQTQAAASGNKTHDGWLTAIARDLQQHRGKSLVIAGDYQPPAVHALAHAMNQSLGNIGNTVIHSEPLNAKVAEQAAEQTASLGELVAEMDAGRVELLVIVGGNPVYNAPVDYKFAERMQKVRQRVQWSLFHDETSALCHWHIPASHYLETWSDARAYDGTTSIIQPLIAPLYQSKSPHEFVAAFTSQPNQTSYDIVRAFWKSQPGSAPTSAGGDFEQWWSSAVRTGIIKNSSPTPSATAPSTNQPFAATNPKPQTPNAEPQLEILFRPDPSIYDGRFAENGWLQELPKPLTKLTWDNAAEISPATAKRLGLSYEIASRGGEHGQVLADVVELKYQGRTVRAPIWIVPGHADDCVTVHLGYGRTRGGKLGVGVGFNAYLLRTSDAPWFGAGLTLSKTGAQHVLATTQLHHNMQGRELVRATTLSNFQQHPQFAEERKSKPTKSLYPEWAYPGYAWGMAIDVNSCVGCNACVIACQSENNIPVVGKEEVTHGREMHWLRIDRYYEGAPERPETYFQPVLCQHCEDAPCELVCPVGATVHSSEGLNDMVYNRCVGTRYCSNNCPYKVRRFNFLLYQDWNTPQYKMQRNPDVSVRSRGVMEKCTYCVQRIQEAKITAEKEGRAVRDGEIKTACQQACPTEAIIFGNINDTNSRVAKLKAEPRNYNLLGELNTRPRTTYLAAVRNPNPELAEA